MSELPIRPGVLVRSTAGRDSGNCYVVVRLTASRLVAVSDGQFRPVDRPKTKNWKHLAVIGTVDPTLRDRLDRGERITNVDIQNAIGTIRDN